MSDKTAEQLQDELTEMTITAGEWREKCEALEASLRGCLEIATQTMSKLHPIGVMLKSVKIICDNAHLPQQEKEEGR